MKEYRICAVVMAAAALAAAPAQSQSVADFYKDKTIRMLVASGVGGGTDVLSRIFMKYLSEHMPGKPAVVVQNVPAGGGLIAAQQLYTAARDGTVIGGMMRTIPLLPLVSEQTLNFDPRQFSWLANLNRETNVFVTWHTSPTKTFEDIFKRETIVGSSGAGSDTWTYAMLVNKMLGAKLKPVTGYPGGPEIDLAMQRGEVEGRVAITLTSLKTNRSHWVKNKEVNMLVQFALRREPDIPDVRTILEFVKDPIDHQVWELLLARQEAGRPYAAPPDVPADRLAALRKAFGDAARDHRFIKDVESKGGSVEFMSGEELQAFIDKQYKAPPAVLKAAQAVLAQ